MNLVFCSRIFCALFFLTTLLPNEIFSQDHHLISGTVIDSKTKIPLPFASISLKKHLTGTSANEEGRFELIHFKDSVADTLLISYLGYQMQRISLNNCSEKMEIKMEASSFDLMEVVIRPLLPTDYIQMAVRSFKDNYSNKPFETQSYYREIVKENERFVSSSEFIIKSNCKSYTDTAANQHQICLLRKADDLHSVEFMSKKRKKLEDRRIRKSQNNNSGDTDSSKAFSKLFGGPELVLKASHINLESYPFLDSNEFKHFNYSFGPSGTLNGNEIIEIDIESRDYSDLKNGNGKIYIDAKSNAIVKSDCTGEIPFPFIGKSMLLLMQGMTIENPKITLKTSYEEIAGRWYPKLAQIEIQLALKKIHLFSKDEQSVFKINNLYSVNAFKLENATPIPIEKRLNLKKKIEEQVYNDDNLLWENMNIIKD